MLCSKGLSDRLQGAAPSKARWLIMIEDRTLTWDKGLLLAPPATKSDVSESQAQWRIKTAEDVANILVGGLLLRCAGGRGVDSRVRRCCEVGTMHAILQISRRIVRRM
jgi:hypothetical protein